MKYRVSFSCFARFWNRVLQNVSKLGLLLKIIKKNIFSNLSEKQIDPNGYSWLQRLKKICIAIWNKTNVIILRPFNCRALWEAISSIKIFVILRVPQPLYFFAPTYIRWGLFYGIWSFLPSNKNRSTYPVTPTLSCVVYIFFNLLAWWYPNYQYCFFWEIVSS